MSFRKIIGSFVHSERFVDLTHHLYSASIQASARQLREPNPPIPFGAQFLWSEPDKDRSGSITTDYLSFEPIQCRLFRIDSGGSVKDSTTSLLVCIKSMVLPRVSSKASNSDLNWTNLGHHRGGNHPTTPPKTDQIRTTPEIARTESAPRRPSGAMHVPRPSRFLSTCQRDEEWKGTEGDEKPFGPVIQGFDGKILGFAT
jgi:hypothetical protein